MPTSPPPPINTRRHAKLVGLVALAVLALVLLLRLIGAQRHLPPESLTLFLSADTRGHLEPCACRADPSGGMTVRGTVLTREAASPRLLIDAGNVLHSPYDFDLLKFDYLLQAMETMNYDVVNLGAKEVAVEREKLLAAVKRHPKLAFTSCNVLDAEARQPVVAPYLIKRISSFRVGFLGVVRNDLDAVGKGLTVSPPREALGQWVPLVAKRCDYLVIVAFVDQATLKEIADQFYEADVVLGGDVPVSSAEPEKVNQALVFSVTGEGKVLGRIDLRRTPENKLRLAEGRPLKVEESIPGDPALLKIAEAFKENLRRRRVALGPQEENLEAIPTGETVSDRYLGAQVCVQCHQAEQAVWQHSAHARGVKTLARSNHRRNPECLVCHATAYQSPDGYDSEEKTPELGMVTCEACHGRGDRHVQAMRRHEKPLSSTFRVVTPSTCLTCHDQENSPKFAYATYWSKIRHGRGPKR